MWFEKVLGITFSYKDGRITIFHSVFKILNNPKFYIYLYNQDDKQLAIQSCDFNDSGSHKIPIIKEQDSFEIKSKDLIHLIYKDTSWDKNYSYRVTGSYISKFNLVHFDLKDGNKLMKEK